MSILSHSTSTVGEKKKITQRGCLSSYVTGMVKMTLIKQEERKSVQENNLLVLEIMCSGH